MAYPIRIGVLTDTAEVAPGDGSQPGIEGLVRLAVDELVGQGRIDREVEYVHAYALGLPGGTAAAVEAAFVELESQDVLAILGPAIGDNALVATPLAEDYQVPTINWAGTERARSNWMFHLQVGSHEDESILLARHLAALGARRIGVVYDRSPIGRRYFTFLQNECEVLGMVTTAVSVPPLLDHAAGPAAITMSASVDAVVYLGLGLAAPAVATTVKATGLDVPMLMNTAGLRGYSPDFAAVIDGWIYVDMISDQNTVYANLVKKMGGVPPFAVAAAFGYDMGQLIAEGLARASELTRSGVREGLEQVKWIPAAEGAEGTVLSLGHYDHGALHGRYLVLRQWLDGRSVEV